MATPTYDLIAEQVLASPAAAITFSSISSTYRDVIAVARLVVDNSNNPGYARVRFNGDATDTNYSRTETYGGGGAGGAFRAANNIICMAGSNVYTEVVTNVLQFAAVNSANVNKSCIYRQSSTTNNVLVASMLWRNAAAVTSIGFIPYSATQFLAGTRIALYGIAG